MHIYANPICHKHNPPPDRALFPARLSAVMEALRAPEFAGLTWREPPLLAPEELFVAHTPAYVANILSPLVSERRLTPDTVAVPGTANAALAAASTVAAAAQDVMQGNAQRAFCIVSPPGHHAEADAAGGFCFFNNVAVAALRAQKNFGARRIAVVDFDAHHGNGTQSLFWNFEDRLFISLHEETPGSGLANETGAWNNVLNLPLPKGTGSELFRKTFSGQALPKLEAFRPDILFVSAGFDMREGDPQASLRLTEADYRWLGETLRSAAGKLCEGRLVAALEGGYNPGALGACAAAFVSGTEGPTR